MMMSITQSSSYPSSFIGKRVFNLDGGAPFFFFFIGKTGPTGWLKNKNCELPLVHLPTVPIKIGR